MAAWALLLGCAGKRAAPAEANGTAASAATDDRGEARRTMVTEQIEARGVSDPRVLEAMRKVPRHEFVPREQRPYAYADHPLPIGHDRVRALHTARAPKTLAPHVGIS